MKEFNIAKTILLKRKEKKISNLANITLLMALVLQYQSIVFLDFLGKMEQEKPRL